MAHDFLVWRKRRWKVGSRRGRRGKNEFFPLDATFCQKLATENSPHPAPNFPAQRIEIEIASTKFIKVPKTTIDIVDAIECIEPCDIVYERCRSYHRRLIGWLVSGSTNEDFQNLIQQCPLWHRSSTPARPTWPPHPSVSMEILLSYPT